jgi:hypothetical protein
LPNVGKHNRLQLLAVKDDRTRAAPPLPASLAQLDAFEIMNREFGKRTIPAPDQGAKIGEMVLLESDEACEPRRTTRPEQPLPRKREV